MLSRNMWGIIIVTGLVAGILVCQWMNKGQGKIHDPTGEELLGSCTANSVIVVIVMVLVGAVEFGLFAAFDALFHHHR